MTRDGPGASCVVVQCCFDKACFGSERLQLCRSVPVLLNEIVDCLDSCSTRRYDLEDIDRNRKKVRDAIKHSKR